MVWSQRSQYGVDTHPDTYTETIIVPDDLFEKLGDHQKTFIAVKFYTYKQEWGKYPTIKDLAKICGVSENEIIETLDCLVELGILENINGKYFFTKEKGNNGR